jgi:integral membrane protein
MSPRTAFRIVAIAEAVSWAGLLIGMLFKYVVSDNPTGVHVFGPIHGGVFMLYCLTVLAVCRPLRWSPVLTLVALASSIPPFATLAFDLWAERTGRLPAEARFSTGFKTRPAEANADL